MLTSYSEAQGDYDLLMRSLLQQSRSHASPAFSALHARLLWCQVDSDDLSQLRDRVLVPEVSDLLAKSGGHSESADDLIDLLALVPIPKEPKALEACRFLIATMQKGPNLSLEKRMNYLRLAAAIARSSPPPAVR